MFRPQATGIRLIVIAALSIGCMSATFSGTLAALGAGQIEAPQPQTLA